MNTEENMKLYVSFKDAIQANLHKLLKEKRRHEKDIVIIHYIIHNLKYTFHTGYEKRLIFFQKAFDKPSFRLRVTICLYSKNVWLAALVWIGFKS